MKCLSCGAEIKLDPKTGKLKCDYCEAVFDPKDYEAQVNKASENEVINDNKEKLNSKIYSCSQCGANILTFDDTAVTFCSYCGSSQVLEPKLNKEKAPNLIIPFSITKEKCEEIFKKEIKKYLFAPSYMKDNVEISKFRGIYMPYCVYTAEKHGTEVNKGEKYSHRSGDYVYYDEYDIVANIDAKYEGMSYDLASNFLDKFSNAIGPFNYKDAVEFKASYLSGFYADSRDVEEDIYSKDAEKDAEVLGCSDLRKYKEYKRYGCSKPKVNLGITESKIAYYPVYFLAFRNKKNNTVNYAVMNGQNGKLAIEMPVDFKKYLIFSLLGSLPIFGLLNLFLVSTPKRVLFFSVAFLILNIVISFIQNDKIKKHENLSDDKGIVSKKNNKKSKESNIGLKNNWYLFIGLIISALVFFINPVSDIFYYGCVSISLILVIISFFSLVKRSNALTTRKLSQLERRGGDERE